MSYSLFGWAMMLAFWVLAILLIVWAARSTINGGNHRTRHTR